MTTHRNIAVSMANSIINNYYPPQQPIVNLAAAPMTHTAGFLSIPCSARGGTVVVLTKPDPVALLDAVEKHRVTEFFLPPTVIYRLLETPDLGKRDLSSLRYLMYGAAPMSVERLKQALTVFGPILFKAMDKAKLLGHLLPTAGRSLRRRQDCQRRATQLLRAAVRAQCAHHQGRQWPIAASRRLWRDLRSRRNRHEGILQTTRKDG